MQPLLQVILNGWCDAPMLHALKATSKVLYNEFTLDKTVETVHQTTKQEYLNQFAQVAQKIYFLSTPNHAFIQQLSVYPTELQLTVAPAAIEMLNFEVVHYLLSLGLCPHQLSKVLSAPYKHFQPEQSQMMRLLVKHGASAKDVPRHLYQKMSLNNIMFLLVQSDLCPNLVIDDHGMQLLYHVLTDRGLQKQDQYSFLCDFMYHGCDLYHPHGSHDNMLLADALLISTKVSPAVKHYVLRNGYDRFMIENPVTHQPYLHLLVHNTEFEVWKDYVLFDETPILYLLSGNRDLSTLEGQHVFMALLDAGAPLQVPGRRPVIDHIVRHVEYPCPHLIQTLVDRGAPYTGNWYALVLELNASPNYFCVHTPDPLTVEVEQQVLAMFPADPAEMRSEYRRACDYLLALGRKHPLQHVTTMHFLRASQVTTADTFDEITTLFRPVFFGLTLEALFNEVCEMLAKSDAKKK